MRGRYRLRAALSSIPLESPLCPMSASFPRKISNMRPVRCVGSGHIRFGEALCSAAHGPQTCNDGFGRATRGTTGVTRLTSPISSDYENRGARAIL
jgi:hypothetical protein